MKILFIIPHHDFYDEEYFELKTLLENPENKIDTASTHLSEAQGKFKHLVEPDFLISSVMASDYDAYVLIGGEGAKELYHDEILHSLIRDIIAARKLLILFSEAVMVLYFSGIINNRRVTALENMKSDLEAGGAYFTGTEIEYDDDLITASGHYAVPYIAKDILKFSNKR